MYYFNMASCTRAVCNDLHDKYSAAERAKAEKDGPPRGRSQSKTRVRDRSNSKNRKGGSKGGDRSTSQNSQNSKGSKGSRGSKGKGKGGKRGGSQERKPKPKPAAKPMAAGAVSKPLFTMKPAHCHEFLVNGKCAAHPGKGGDCVKPHLNAEEYEKQKVALNRNCQQQAVALVKSGKLVT